jgi:ribosomal protein S18 acetylase RimI-like enzyme
MIIDNLFNRKPTIVEGSAANDYFTRRKSEEERIAGTRAPAKNKKNPATTDYSKRRAQEKKQGLNEFAPGAGDDGDGGDDQEEILFKYAKMWYNASYETQDQIERMLDKMGWEIGEIESEEGGAFVIQPGDEHGRSYIGWTAADLTQGVAESAVIQEIEKISSYDYTGGKYQLSGENPPKQLFELPGGSGLLYSIKNMPNPVIQLWDPKNPQPKIGPKPVKSPYELAYEYYDRLDKWDKQYEKLKQQGRLGNKPLCIGQLTLNSVNVPGLKDPLKVDSITVDEDYRGRGLAKALYGIVLAILKKQLVAGDSQTPGGQKNWVGISQIPGAQVYGYVMIDNDDLDEYTDKVMGKLGGDYMGPGGGYHFFRFAVRPNASGKELASYVKTKAINLYGQSWDTAFGGLYAVWEPQQMKINETSAKSAIYQTEVFGAKAYHSRCLEPGCDWESRRFDRVKQAQDAAKKHSQTHFKSGTAPVAGSNKTINREDKKMNINDVLLEFAPGAGGGGGSGDYLRALASAWYNETFNTGSLKKGIKSQEDVERLLARGIVSPDGKTRKYNIDYNPDFDGVVIFSDDYYEHDDGSNMDSRTGQKWGPYDYIEFSSEELDESVDEGVIATLGDDPWGPPGNFAGDRPINVGDVSMKTIEVGDTVKYFGQKVKVVAMSKNRKYSRIKIPSDFGGTTKDVLTSDLKQLGQGVAEGPQDDPEDYRAHLLKTLPRMMNFLSKNVKGWKPTEEQYLAAIETGYQVMKHTGDVQQAGKAMSDELNTLHKMSQGQQGVAEASFTAAASMNAANRKQSGGKTAQPTHGFRVGNQVTTRDGKEGQVTFVHGDTVHVKGTNDYYPDHIKHYSAKDLKKGVAEGTNKLAKQQHANRQQFKSTKIKETAISGAPQTSGIPATATTSVPGMKATQQDLKKAGASVALGEGKCNHTPKGKSCPVHGLKECGSYMEGSLDEKSTSQAQFRTMAAAAHNPEFARKVGIKQSVAKEFNRADKGRDYKNLPKKANESKKAHAGKEADYGDDYQDMVKRVKKLAGLGPLQTVYDPHKRVYRNVPRAEQPKKPNSGSNTVSESRAKRRSLMAQMLKGQ